MRKLISVLLTLALALSGAIVRAESTNELTLTGPNLSASSTAIYADDKITIAAGQKAIFDVSVDDKITYDVTLPDVDVSTLATYKYQVLLSYDSKDVIKLYNDKVKAQPGWITFQANTTALTFENLGTTDMILTSVKLTKKVFGADEDMLYAPAATSWLYGAWGLNSPKFVFYGQVSSSYQTMSEWVGCLMFKMPMTIS